MSYFSFALLLASGLVAGMLVLLEIGHRLGERFERTDPAGAHTGTGPVEGAIIFALLGLRIDDFDRVMTDVRASPGH